MKYSKKVKKILLSEIDKLDKKKNEFISRPDRDFSRNRKFSFKQLVHFTITMQSGTLKKELMDYFSYDPLTISPSAYCQQRNKILPGTYEHLSKSFMKNFSPKPFKGKYRLMACDGTAFTYTRTPEDVDSYYPPDGKSTNGYNQMYVVASYDILSKTFDDAEIQPSRKKNEFLALANLMDRYESTDAGLTPIFICDRGFHAYNVFAHAMENNLMFMIRAKDNNLARIVGHSIDDNNLPLDVNVSRILTRSASKKKRRQPEREDDYRYICSDVKMDYITPENPEYELPLRVLRFEIKEGVYENIITNLPREEFSVDEIKDLYHLRWDIETSFLQLKKVLGAVNLHSKKKEHIEQELWARIILYNFCTLISMNIAVKKDNRKHSYQINFTVAFNACTYLARLHNGESPPDIEALLGRNLLPVREGRSYPRIKRLLPPASFTYRY